MAPTTRSKRRSCPAVLQPTSRLTKKKISSTQSKKAKIRRGKDEGARIIATIQDELKIIRKSSSRIQSKILEWHSLHDSLKTQLKECEEEQQILFHLVEKYQASQNTQLEEKKNLKESKKKWKKKLEEKDTCIRKLKEKIEILTSPGGGPRQSTPVAKLRDMSSPPCECTQKSGPDKVEKMRKILEEHGPTSGGRSTASWSVNRRGASSTTRKGLKIWQKEVEDAFVKAAKWFQMTPLPDDSPRKD